MNTQEQDNKLAAMEVAENKYEEWKKEREIIVAKEIAEDEANKDKFTHVCLKVYLNRTWDLVWPNGAPEFEELFEKEFGYKYSGYLDGESPAVESEYIIHAFTKPLKDNDYFYDFKGLRQDMFEILHPLIVEPFSVGFDINIHRCSEDLEIISNECHYFTIDRGGVSSMC